MKQMGVLFICLIFVFSTVVAYAAPVGNIATPKTLKKGLIIRDEESQFGIVIGPEADLIFNRNLEDQAVDTEYRFYGGKAGVIVGNKAILYGLYGVADADQKFKILGSEVKWVTETDPAWGAGASLIIYEKEIEVRGKGVLRIGIDGRYRISDLDVDKVILDDTPYNLPDASVSETKFNFSEWQVALEVAYQTDRLVPYAGVKYSDIDGKAKTTISATEYKMDFCSEQKIGFFAGADALITDSVSAHVEGRFGDETALSAGATIRF